MRSIHVARGLVPSLFAHLEIEIVILVYMVMLRHNDFNSIPCL